MVRIPRHHLPAKAEMQFDNAVVLQPAVETAAQNPEAKVQAGAGVEAEAEAGPDVGHVTGLRAAAVTAVTDKKLQKPR
jgi:hypothetical protein